MSVPTPRQATFAGVLLLANRMQTTYDAQLSELTLKQWLALTVVHAFRQPVPSAAVVAEALGTSHQNATKLLTALERKGYLRFSPSPDDARARRIELTDRALDYFSRHADLGEALLDDLFAEIPAADVSTCLRVLDAMSRSLTGAGLTPEPSTP